MKFFIVNIWKIKENSSDTTDNTNLQLKNFDQLNKVQNTQVKYFIVHDTFDQIRV